MTQHSAIAALVQGITMTLSDTPCLNHPAGQGTCKDTPRAADASDAGARWCLPCLVDELLKAEGPDLYDEVSVTEPGNLILALQALPKRRILDREGDEDYVSLADVLGLVLSRGEQPPSESAQKPEVEPVELRAEPEDNDHPTFKDDDTVTGEVTRRQDDGPTSQLGPESDF